MRFILTLFTIFLSGIVATALDVPSLVKDREPVVVKHEPGTQIQIVPWGLTTPGFHDETFIKRFEDHTVFGARPGIYLVAGDGVLAWVVIGDDPSPPVPGPDPVPPGPGPAPGPDPEPATDCDNVPEDAYGNLGKATCQALKNVVEADKPLKDSIRTVYLDVAAKMNNPGESGLRSLNDGINYLRQEMGKVVRSGTSWDVWAKDVQTKIDSQEIGRSDLASVCIAISEGLK